MRGLLFIILLAALIAGIFYVYNMSHNKNIFSPAKIESNELTGTSTTSGNYIERARNVESVLAKDANRMKQEEEKINDNGSNENQTP